MLLGRGRKDRMYNLVGCGIFAGWVSAGYAVFRSNGLFSWVLGGLLIVAGLLAFFLYLGAARKGYCGLKKERLIDGFVLLAIGLLFIVADCCAIDYLAQFGPVERWLKNYAEAVIVWSVSVIIVGFWLLLAPSPKSNQALCTR